MRYMGIDGIYEGAMESSRNKQRSLKRFIHYNKLSLNQISANGMYNLFIPKELGGVGLVLPKGISQYKTIFQKCLGRKLYNLRKRGLRSEAPDFLEPVRVSVRYNKRNLPKKWRSEHDWYTVPYGPLRQFDQLLKDPEYTLQETFSQHAPELEQDRQGLSILKIKTNFLSRTEIDSILRDSSLRSGGLRKPIELIPTQRWAHRDLRFDILDPPPFDPKEQLLGQRLEEFRSRYMEIGFEL